MDVLEEFEMYSAFKNKNKNNNDGDKVTKMTN